MKKLSVMFFVIFLQTFSFAEIFEINHFSEITSYLTRDSLILLDIDDTLLIPKQMLGCDEWFQCRLKKYRSQGMNTREALEASLAEWEAVRHLTQMETPENETASFVQDLQEKKYTIMGLTTQGLALATRTAIQLKENQLDLSLTSPSQKDCYFCQNEHGILFRHGILFTSGTPKGEALFHFLNVIGYKPSRIIFVNDKASHLADVEGKAKEKRIAFIGLRYAFSDEKKRLFSEKIAEIQFTRSSFAHLLSDSEAQKILNEASFP